MFVLSVRYLENILMNNIVVHCSIVRFAMPGHQNGTHCLKSLRIQHRSSPCTNNNSTPHTHTSELAHTMLVLIAINFMLLLEKGTISH